MTSAQPDPLPETFFTVDGEWFRPTVLSRGPWSEHACHAGPPTGLLARAAEQLVPDQQLVRLTVELTKPIPFSGFRIESSVVRSGRMVSTTTHTIIDESDEPVTSARAMHVTAGEPHDFPTIDVETPRFDDATVGGFPIAVAPHGHTMFTSAVEMRYPPGQDNKPGPTTAWMRTCPLLPDETPSGFQRICPLADCGNAISRNAHLDRVTFVNSDLTLQLFREPVGEWQGTRSRSFWEPTGIGLSDSLLFDRDGAVGRALQTVLLRPAS